MPDDFDAMIISRSMASSGLQQPRSHPLPSDPHNSNAQSSSMDDSDAASASGSESSAEGLTQQDIQEHKKAAVQQAFLNGTLGFGFSAGGLVFPYYVGLVSQLVQAGVLQRPSQLAGSSAGSLIAASFNAGLDMATVEKSMIDFGEDCLKNGTRYRLGPLLRDFLQQYLPPNAHELCSGTTHVAVTRLLPYWQTQMVSQFDSREDLIHALLTSCHIPWYFDGRWMTKFRGHYCVDGGVMAFIPTVPGADYTVKVMCFPSSHLSRLKATTRSSRRLKRLHDLLDIDITMDSHEHWPYDLQQIVKWALVASAADTSSLLIEKGKRDAALWMEAMELAPLVQQQQQQKQQQQGLQDKVIDIGWGSGAAAAGAGGEDAAAQWSDQKGSQRKREAERAHEMTAEAEQAAAAAAEGNGSGAAVEDVAAAAGVDEKAAQHARDAASLAEPPAKKHRVGEAAEGAAAAVGQAASGLRKAVVGGCRDGHLNGPHEGNDQQNRA